MDFYTKYQAEFTDLYDVDWTVFIQEWAAGSFTIKMLTCTGSPLSFEWYGNDDPYNQRIIGSKMELNVWSETDFELLELFTSENLKYKVIVYYGSTLYWGGFILPESYREPYDSPPLNTTIVATDGLGILKDFKFTELGYIVRTKASVIIYDILSLVGITTFTEYVNLYNASMSSYVGDSPFDQMGIDPDLFETKSCYEALEIILVMLNAFITQDLGIVTIYRIDEFKDATIYGRIFDTGTTKTATTKTTDQYINRIGQVSDLWDIEGGALTGVPQAKTLIINYNMGLKKSIFDNWEFQCEKFVYSSPLYTIQGWTNSHVVISPLSTVIPGEDRGIYLFGYVEGEYDYYIQTYVTGVEHLTPNFKLKYQFRVKNTYIDPHSTYIFYELFMVGNTNKYFTSSTENGVGDGWTDTYPFANATYTYVDCPPGWSDWIDVEVVVDSISIDGYLYLRLYQQFSVNTLMYAAYRDVQIVFAPTLGGDETGIGYTTSCATTGRIIEKEVFLGDGLTGRRNQNQLISYAGIINNYSGGGGIRDPSFVWHTRGSTENKAVYELTSEEIGAQYERARQVIDLPLREMDADTHLSCIGNIQDEINTGLVFHPSISTFDVRNREYQLVLTEII